MMAFLKEFFLPKEFNVQVLQPTTRDGKLVFLSRTVPRSTAEFFADATKSPIWTEVGGEREMMVVRGWQETERLADELTQLKVSFDMHVADATAARLTAVKKLMDLKSPNCDYCGTHRGFVNGSCRACGAPEP